MVSNRFDYLQMYNKLNALKIENPNKNMRIQSATEFIDQVVNGKDRKDLRQLRHLIMVIT